MKILVLRYNSSFASTLSTVDRFLSLALFLSTISRNNDVTLVSSSFAHNTRTVKSPSLQETISLHFSFVKFVNCPSYHLSIGFGRLFSEFIYAIKSIPYIFSGRYDKIIVGEPAFFVGWLSLFSKIIYPRVEISSDVIDIWPEAICISKLPLTKKILIFVPFYLFIFSRYIRLHFYSKISFVSKHYLNLLVPKNSKKSTIVSYWCRVPFKENDTSYLHLEEALDIKTTNLLNSKYIFGYFGGLGQMYDLLTLKKAFKYLSDDYPDLHLLVAGNGAKRSLFEESMPPNITYLGYLDAKTLDHVISETNCIILPYSAESMVSIPVKFFDAVAQDKPIISSLQMETQEIISRYDLGLSYRAGSTNDLIKCILYVFHHSTSVTYNASIGCKELKSIFSFKINYTKLADFHLRSK